jgi:hypothetical protein
MARLETLDADARCVMAVLIELAALREEAALLFTNRPFLMTKSFAIGARIGGPTDLAFPAGLISRKGILRKQ